ncbi:MAG: efflux RND transporter periplasmic adaptor subunit [Acetobacteraceae bacterium]|nr:efflux RND transporter periplasmic adaptor subunit [Acetobacteraceae bacterium]
MRRWQSRGRAPGGGGVAGAAPPHRGRPRFSVTSLPALVLALGLALVSLALSGAGCAAGRAQGEGEAGAVPVAVADATSGDIQVRALVPGQVAPRSEVTVCARVGGRVAEAAVSLGARVEAGQLLVRLESQDMEAQVRQAQAALDAARANLARLQKGARPQEREQAQAQVAQAEAAYQDALANFSRVERLWADGAVSQQQYEASRLQLRTAEAALTAAREQLSLIQEGSGAEVLAAAAAQVRQAQAALELAQSQLAQTRVVAPSAGLVAACNVEAGELVSPGLPLLTLVDIDRVVIEVGLAQDLVNLVSPGQELEVLVPAAGEAATTARVTAVAPAADARTRTFLAQLEADNPGHRLKPGMFCQVLVVQAEHHGVLLVPQEALVESEGRTLVFVAEDGVARERRVEVGLRDGARAEVLSGLKPGERVVVAGQHYLHDGARIRVTGP